MHSFFSSTNKKWKGSLRVYFKKGKGQAYNSHLINGRFRLTTQESLIQNKIGPLECQLLGARIFVLFTAFIPSA